LANGKKKIAANFSMKSTAIFSGGYWFGTFEATKVIVQQRQYVEIDLNN
jgi:hypothetical protein